MGSEVDNKVSTSSGRHKAVGIGQEDFRPSPHFGPVSGLEKPESEMKEGACAQHTQPEVPEYGSAHHIRSNLFRQAGDMEVSGW